MMYDEKTDLKSVSQFAVCLRLVDGNLDANNGFIGLKNMPITDADSIAWKLKDILLRMDMKLGKFWGQCYDVSTCLVQKVK